MHVSMMNVSMMHVYMMHACRYDACIYDAANFVMDQRTNKVILGVGYPFLKSFLARSKMTQLNLILKAMESPQGITSNMCIIIHIIPIVTDSSSSQVMRL